VNAATVGAGDQPVSDDPCDVVVVPGVLVLALSFGQVRTECEGAVDCRL
jgi:hypothetical protein